MSLSTIPHRVCPEDMTLGPLFYGTHFTDLYKISLANHNSGEFRTAAVKVWRHESSTTEEGRKIFRKMLNRKLKPWTTIMNHPNIEKIFGLTADTERRIPVGVIMPYRRNGNAFKYLKHNPSANFVLMLRDIASALHYMHSHNPPIVHGKIRGSNILISDEGRPLLADIGLRDLKYPSDSRYYNDPEEIRWMAQELVMDENAPIAPACDVHSFAMTALELLTLQRHHWWHRNKYAIMVEIQKGVRPSRPDRCPQLTDNLWNLLQECWSPDPLTRSDMGSVMRRLSASSY
ncbi:hypothetical protein D9613_001325 [Agrocybe pediades]|uniref:Protein kinase domain-containing protein n=1 Tax=Agrocybe pediades TaxID=84607 RepID=A0A8H4R6X8_9AGAR|nr:hypothetical protein D9613_001325 [Agrocybe pediades]